jgi:hypothetical protein
MLRTARGIFLNWHLVLDTTITHFLAIYFSHAQRFDLAAGIVVADSVLKLVFALPCATVATQLRLAARVSACTYLRPGLTLLWLCAFTLCNSNFDISIVVTAFALFKALLIVDVALSSDFGFLAKDAFGIDLSQNNSIQNIVSRASIAIAPVFALSILNQKLNLIYAICLTLICTGIGASVLKSIHRFNKNQELPIEGPNEKPTTTSNLFTIFNSNYMRWGMFYQLLVNFSFGGISYLLIVKVSSNLNSTMNELSMLYSFFFIYSVAISIFGDAAIPAHRLRNIVQIIATTATLSISLSIAMPSFARFILCAAMGVLYAYELAAVQKVLMPKLRGPDYIRYSALLKIGSRTASALAVAILGACVELGVPSTALFLACGLSGLCCALALYIADPERQRALSVIR